jgi:aminopeptidase N
MYRHSPHPALLLILVLLLAACSSYPTAAPLAPTPSLTPSSTLSLATPSSVPPSTPLVSSPTPDSSTIGSPGIGDSYFPLLGNGGYDVQHYTVDLVVDMDANTISGTVTVDASATQNLTRFDLDYTGPAISAVSVDGRPADFSRSGGELTITPAAGLEKGQPFAAAVTYRGTPGCGQSGSQPPVYMCGWTRYDQGVLVAAEPSGQSSWLPLNETPADKASYTFRITVARPWVVAANGLQKSVTDNGSTRTYLWQTDNPLAPYLVTLAIGRFTEETDTSSGVLVRNYIADGYPADVARAFDSTPQMISYYESVFGKFPFEAYGVVAHNTKLNFSLESQTLTVFGNSFVTEMVAAHELAHSWFGDSLTPARWQDIWLNEGFASFAADLWEEHVHGKAYAEKALSNLYQNILKNEKDVAIGNPGPNAMFGFDVYNRGNMLLHALRARLNDDATFFKILQTYAQRYYHANVNTQDFISLAEEVSGQKLESFFQDWLYGTSMPDIPELGLSASQP